MQIDDSMQLGAIKDGDLVLEYLEDRWLALVHGKGTGQCEDCHGCCKSNYVIGLTKEEAEHIPHTIVEGYPVIMPNDDGVCPLFINNTCSIYRTRPASCRQFDCRDMAFAGLLVTNDDALAGADEMNESISRHIRNNGNKILFPMRQQAIKALELEDNAPKAAQIAMLTTMHALLPTKKFKQALNTLTQREKDTTEGQEAGIKLLNERKKEKA